MKKSCSLPCRTPAMVITLKTLLVMKLTAVLLITACLQVSANGNAQTISISQRNTSLEKVFKEIHRKTGYQFFYQDELLRQAKKFDIHVKNGTVEQVLELCFKDQPLNFTITEKAITIERKEKVNVSNALPPPPVLIDFTGKVKDENGKPLAGVSVSIVGGKIGVSTDEGGNFSIAIPENGILSFSYVGYKTVTVPVKGKTSIEITLNPEISSMNAIVVVGYSTQKKTSVTSAISTLRGEEIAATPITNLSNSLGGRVSGVIVKQGSGEPGLDGSNIYIRGISSTGANQPLIIVDGIPRSFQQLDPNTIESMTVLKDAAAEAPYGVAGANGVILVTTKRGKTGAPSLTYNGYVGFQNSTFLPDYVDSYQYGTLKNAAAKNDGLPAPYSNAALQKYQDGSDQDAYPNWDVFKAVVTPNAILTNHNIELSGGADRIKYYASLGYQYQQGMWSTTNFNRYNLAINLDAEATKTTKISFNVNGRVQQAAYPAIATNRIFELISYDFPTTPLLFSNGLPGNYTWGSIFNSGYKKNNLTSLYSQLSIEQKIPFISGLTAKVMIAYDPATSMEKIWRTPVHIYSIDTSKRPYVYKDGIFEQAKASLDQLHAQSQQITYQASLNYITRLGKNNIGALAVFEAKANNSSNFGGGRRNYNLLIDEISMGSSSLTDINMPTGSSSSARQMGMVYRLTYDYDGKYLFEASGRYDGSYYFAPGKQFGFFPAFSAGWRLSKENFIKDNLAWIDNLKLRASYGEVGALAGSAFQFLSTYGISGPAYVFNGNGVQGVNERSEPNLNITWERAKKTDIGLEAILWKGLLNIEADYFYEKRSNMLAVPDVIVPVEYGIGLSQRNAGIMENKGFDLSLSSVYNISRDFQVSLGSNFTYAKNALLQVFEGSTTYNNPNRRITGKPLGTQFGLMDLGFFQVDDFDNSGNLKGGIAIQPWGKVRPGDIRYKDFNNDGKINDEDLTEIGNPGSAPRIIYGISPGVNYKGFSLDMLFQGTAKTDFYYFREGAWPFHSGRGAFVGHMNYWTPENTQALNPRITSAPTTNNTQQSSFWMQNASYLRLKSATLAYTIPSNVMQMIRIKSARIYISGQNILTWTKQKNFDPENLNSLGANYPQQKVISLGLNVTF